MVGQPASHSAMDVVAVPHTVVATWPVGTFLENIAVLDGGEFVIAVHNRRSCTGHLGGEHHLWVSMPASPAGMIAHDGGVSVVGGEPGEGPHHLYRVTPTGDVHDRGPIPGTVFLNGFTRGRPEPDMQMDSIAGEVFGIDLDSGGFPSGPQRSETPEDLG